MRTTNGANGNEQEHRHHQDLPEIRRKHRIEAAIATDTAADRPPAATIRATSDSEGIAHMATMTHLSYVEAEARGRLVAAATALADRAGLPSPAPESSRDPLPTPKANGDLLMMAGLAEAVVRLAGEVDDLRTQLAGTRKRGER